MCEAKSMADKHQGSIKQYVNDMIGLEADISHAIRGQLEDDRVKGNIALARLLTEIADASERRLTRLKDLSKEEGGALGAAVKESVTTATGFLAGLYGRVREHPLSRMVRDDIIAQSAASTSYGMLLTLALSAGNKESADIAQDGLRECSPAVIKLTDEMPGIVAQELAEDEPSANPAASQVALAAIRQSWSATPGN